jgi:hypothetical protein
MSYSQFHDVEDESVLTTEHRYCSWCGAEVIEGRPYCPSCGKPNYATSKRPVTPAIRWRLMKSTIFL